MTECGATKDATTRREFIGKTAATTAAALTASSLLPSMGCSNSMVRLTGKKGGLIRSGDVVLFQGDSITDAGRDRQREGHANDVRALGTGYALLAAAALLANHPEAKLTIYNRGISGHKVFQLAERWDKDCLALKPDIVSILIGVNDIWHRLDGRYDGTVEHYERDYRALLERTKRELPGVRLVICEPFVLRCGAVNEKWFPDFDGYRAAAKRVASAFDAVFIPFQTMFDEAVRTTTPAYWAGDGVHPTLAGASLMAQTWLQAV
ncbi:MAG TPA: SGNH/GDSL hydrolase family protein [Sedimentisphaerales bacterium]|nr:SGNH/GDSL hydrolase family protein [Sedimentisphaerales bacterium]HRS12345.1 SGNH/GDSL hydrolase family protein [Sedimentisphaerales bacterium]HRV48885.1 SGNH/GDSL hydrolase family protein [Sedimentisphaerales bacterium]